MARAKGTAFNTIQRADCVKAMSALEAGCVDLAFADPPFNIGYEYDVYHDKKKPRDYLSWSREWIAAVYRALKSDGTFWLAIGDEYAAELKLLSQEVGFQCRSWVIWYYTFGVNCKTKFSRSHAHLFYFVKDAKRFTFRADALENRIPSARQLVYDDNRANPTGRLPDDTWVLRPQDLAGCFTTEEDTWYFPRVAGTFKERAGFHGCQMPEQLLGRIIKTCSNEGDVVMDPFSGSATTAAVAKKLGRRYLAFDLSSDYVTRGLARLEGVRVGDPLEGAPEPTVSAPATPQGTKGRKGKKKSDAGDGGGDQAASVDSAALSLLQKGLLEAFRSTYDGHSLDRMVADPELNSQLADACQRLGLPGEPRSWNWALFRMRKAGLLATMPATRRTAIEWEECENYLFASEIAWGQLIQNGCQSLDSILCDPFLAKEFDEIARRWSPGYSSLEYRWAALKLRKSSSVVRSRAKNLSDASLTAPVRVAKRNGVKLPKDSGMYVALGAPTGNPLYVGEATSLGDRVPQIAEVVRKLPECEDLSVRYFLTSCAFTDRLAYQRRLIVAHQPLLQRVQLR